MAGLNPESSIQFLKGVGPRRAEILGKIGIITVSDLLHFLPRRYIDRSMIVPIGTLRLDMNVTIIGRVLGKGILMGRKKRLEVVLGDETGHISLIWFSGYQYLEKMFNKGDIYSVTGVVTYFLQNQMVHPEIERIEDDDHQLIHSGRIIPVYPSGGDLKSAGITGRIFRQMVNKALELIDGHFDEFLPEKYRNDYQLMSYWDAIRYIHYPRKITDINSARRRLAFNELLELQLLILKNRKSKKKLTKKFKCKKPGEKIKQFARLLPYKLTEDQRSALVEIFDDMQQMVPMHRLLQGDVGCGKTVVALLAAVFCAENELQTAIMAPTELLANQHYSGWKEALEKIGIRSTLVTGSLKKAERRKIDKAIADGDIDIIFGTHAIISDAMEFAKLGLVVIDEQHRFGVKQRGKLIVKGQHPDTLVMTATPIPRTLALTLYGDLDITSIVNLPPGRQPVKTVWRFASARQEIYKYLESILNNNGQIFIIYPLVEKSEKLDLQAAEEEYKVLKNKVFSKYQVGLVHGKMAAVKRDKIVTAFKARELDILVATTVIEVGIDIPSASVIVIEHAERFGLSQLHQLRGRVGRGNQKGMAIAVATPPISSIAKDRLDMFQSSSDGFKIAEADLQLRGPGEFFGTRQHGLPELKIANLAIDTDILPVTRKIIDFLLSGAKLSDEDRKLLRYLEQNIVDRQQLAQFG
ncbi:MAG: ATP-dependent DNA helicase RecG [Candidatus Zixiibacteriota bacterium]